MHRVSIALLLLGLSLSHVAFAQEKTTAKPAAAAPAGSLKDLLKKRQEFRATMAKFEEEFQSAQPKRQAEIQKVARATVTDYLTKTLPALGKVAIEEYTTDPENQPAEDAVLEYLGQSLTMSKYTDVYNGTQALVKAGRKHPALYAMNGMARFALDDFTNAKSVLTTAKSLDEEGLPNEAAQYLDVSDDYIKFFEEEKALRAKEKAADDLPRVSLQTTRGEIVIELFENEAPNTVANFISLTEKKFYDGVKFHRVLGNFMAQVGDPNSKDNDPSNDGTGGPGYRIACECYQKNARKHFRGSLSMAHAGKDTGGSQFFMTHRATPHLNPGFTHPETGEPVNAHTVFGRVIKGMDLLLAIQPGDTLEKATVVRKRNHAYKPKTLAEKSAPPEE